jgi:hypothetical protein
LSSNELHYGLNILLYGGPKVGKSTLAATAPAPRLILDAEGGSRFTPGRKVQWNPQIEAPPAADGSWDTCIVSIHDYKSIELAFQWLNSAKHDFSSVIIDSISEAQQRCIDAIVGKNQMQVQDWGALLRNISDLIRSFRDLTTHPVKPLDAVVFIAMMRENAGEFRPYMQGQISTTLPYYTDACALLAYAPLDDGTMVRRLYLSPVNGHPTVGERLGGCLGPYQDNANLTAALQTIRAYANGGEITEEQQHMINL